MLDPSAVQNVTSTAFQMTALLSEVGTYSMRVTNPSGTTSAPATFVVKAPETPAPPQVPGEQSLGADLDRLGVHVKASQ
jgi:hypothetical protein